MSYHTFNFWLYTSEYPCIKLSRGRPTRQSHQLKKKAPKGKYVLQSEQLIPFLVPTSCTASTILCHDRQLTVERPRIVKAAYVCAIPAVRYLVDPVLRCMVLLFY